MHHKQVEFFKGSDFHIELAIGQRKFDPETLIPTIKTNPESYNVCLLAGDICRPNKTFRATQFFELFCAKFDLVLYVEGNHEHWMGNYGRNFDKLAESCSHIENLKFLRQQRYDFEVNGQRFAVLGATLWSDLKSVSATELDYVSHRRHNGGIKAIVRDFSNIRFDRNGSYKPMTPSDYQRLHNSDVDWLKSHAEELAKDRDLVKILMTHHSPTKKSLVGYDQFEVFDATDLESLIISSDYDLVVHGHIHREEKLSSSIGNAILYSDPAGYTQLMSDAKGYVMRPVYTVPVV